jgi:hypothetical protein
MSLDNNDLLDIAREYCVLIEALQTGDRGPLADLNGLLPRLHAAMTTISPANDARGAGPSADLDQRFELFSRLRALLGDLDAYWMEYDVTPNRQEMSGSLADDLTDIYYELKEGLEQLDRSADPGPTLGSWHSGFCKHWGQHVVDAERHLYALAARDRLY